MEHQNLEAQSTEDPALQRALVSLLSSFEKAKEWEWSDLIKWLRKVKGALEKYPKSRVPEKYTLAKRLSQCLNPSLPQGLHYNTLQIYDTIFRHKDENQELFDEDYGMYSAGLFPFFLYASPQNKPEVLGLIEKYYLPKGNTISLCLPGLVTCILPALEDVGNADLVGRIFNVFDRVAEFDRRGLFSAVWLALLRTPRARQGALIFLSKRIPKGMEGDVLSDCFAHRSLFLNALVAGIKDTNVFVQRGTLDLVKTYFPLSGRVLEFREKVILLEASLHLLNRRDFTILRRIWEWTLPDPSNHQQTQDLLELLVPALTLIFDLHPVTKEDALKPLKILEQLLESDALVEDLLGEVTVIVLTYVERYTSDRELSEDILGRSINLFTTMGDKRTAVWKALGIYLSEQLQEKAKATIRIVQFYLCTFPLESEDDSLFTPLLEELLTNLERIEISSLSNALELADLMLSRLHSPFKMDGAVERYRDFFVKLSHEEIKNVEDYRLASRICTTLEKHTSQETSQDWLHCLLSITQVEDTELALVGMESLTALLKNTAPCYAKLKQSLVSDDGHSISSVVMFQLWTLVLDVKHRGRAVTLICQLQQGAPEVFARTIVTALQVGDVNGKVESIRKFAILWKCANEAGELARLFMNGDGLFIIIDSLQHESPMVRHCAREWLLDSVEQLSYILDPLFDILAKPERKEHEDSRFRYKKVYDCPRILDVIRKIKSVLLSGSEAVFVKAEKQKLTPRVQPANRDIGNYLELIVYYSCLYIESDPASSLADQSLQFKDENHAVQAAMCGLMELVLNQGTTTLAFKAVGGVLRCLEFSISSKDSVMQLLLLRQLRALFFNCSLHNDPERFRSLLDSAEFSNVYLYALFTPDLYVRTHWTQFLIDSMPLMMAFLSPDTLARYLDSLIQAFCTLLHDSEDSQCLIAGLSAIVLKVMELAYPERLARADRLFRENYPQIEIGDAEISRKSFFGGMFGLFTRAEIEHKTNPFDEVMMVLFSLFDIIIESSLRFYPEVGNPQQISSIEVLPYTHTRPGLAFSAEYLVLLNAIARQFPQEFMLSVIRLWIKHSVDKAEPNAVSDTTLVKLVKLCGTITFDPVDRIKGCLTFVLQHWHNRTEQGLKICTGLAHFLYCLFSELDIPESSSAVELWTVCIQVLKELENTNLAGIECWTLELIQLIAAKTQVKKEVLGDRKLRKEIQEFVMKIVGKLTSNGRNDLVFMPIPPSVYSGTRESIKEPIANLISLNSALYPVISMFWQCESEQKIASQLQIPISTLLTALENKSAFIDSELSAKLINSVFDSAGAVLVRTIRRQIIDFLASNDFFVSLGSNRFALKHWSKVANQIVIFCYNERTEIIKELLSKIPSGVFVSKNSEKTQTTKILRVICLMIYGGAVDDFKSCTFFLAEKLIDWLKQHESSLLPVVLLTIRVLVYKLSATVLNELWPRIWPHLMSEILEVMNAYRADSSAKNCQLVLSCIKLLELMSILNTEEFHTHQWIFFYDLFDVEFDYGDADRPSMFTPIIPSTILPSQFARYKPVNSDVEIRNERLRRSLIFTQQTVDNKSDLEMRLRNLNQVLLLSCAEQIEIDQVSVETVLEEDILSQNLCL